MRLPSVRQLQAFRLLMHTQSVTETARQLNVTQPAVSKMLLALESNLERKLFNKVGRRLHPGRDAALILSDVERVLFHIEALTLNVNGSKSTRKARLSISSIPTLASSVIVPCLTELMEENKDISAKVISQNFSDVVEQISLMQADLGFMYGYPGYSDIIKAQIIAEQEVVAILHPDHPLAAQSIVTPSLLEGYPIILWEPLTPTGRLVREAFLDEGIIPRTFVETNNSVMSRQFAEQGKGVALLDPLTAYQPGESESFVVRPFRPRIPLRIFCLRSIHGTPSPASERFIEILRMRLRPVGGL